MPKTQAEIDAIAQRLRDSGVPDEINRWLGMTPELLAKTEALIARHSAGDNRRRDDMAKTPGPKEQALRAQREAETDTPATEAATKKAAAKPAKKPVVSKKAKAATTTPAAAAATTEAPAGTAIRPGSKLAIIVKLLAKKNGCTAKEVMAACNWPSISMPQQAKACGVDLHKHKGADGVTRYADHPLV